MLDGITGSQREYIQWLLKTSTGKGKPGRYFDDLTKFICSYCEPG